MEPIALTEDVQQQAHCEVPLTRRCIEIKRTKRRAGSAAPTSRADIGRAARAATLSFGASHGSCAEGSGRRMDAPFNVCSSEGGTEDTEKCCPDAANPGSQGASCHGDHSNCRTVPLRPHRLNKVCFCDTFFSSLKSIRGFACFQLFCGKDSCMDFSWLMRKEAQAHVARSDFM